MPSKETLDRFVARVVENAHDLAIEECARPVFVSGDRVVIRWRFCFDWVDGTMTEMEEVACQRREGERIAEETFFYDPAQRVPRKPDN